MPRSPLDTALYEMSRFRGIPGRLQFQAYHETLGLWFVCDARDLWRFLYSTARLAANLGLLPSETLRSERRYWRAVYR